MITAFRWSRPTVERDHTLSKSGDGCSGVAGVMLAVVIVQVEREANAGERVRTKTGTETGSRFKR